MSWADVDDTPHLSASQIGMYQRCPKQYEFRYIKGMKRPPGMALIVGTSVHASIELNYKKKHKTKKAEHKDTVMDAFSQTFEEKKHEADGDEPEGQAKDRGYAMADAHYEHIAPTLQPVEPPELEFSVVIPGVKRKLYGFMDVIGEPIAAVKKAGAKAKRLIMDNKTGRRKHEQLAVELSVQLTAYDFAHRQLFGKKPDGVGFDAMIEKKTKGEVSTEVQRIVTVRSEGEIERFAETVRHIEKGITSGVFPPVDDAKTCGWCGYKDVCNSAATKRAAAVSQW